MYAGVKFTERFGCELVCVSVYSGSVLDSGNWEEIGKNNRASLLFWSPVLCNFVLRSTEPVSSDIY